MSQEANRGATESVPSYHKKPQEMRKQIEDFTGFGPEGSPERQKQLDPHRVAFYVLIDDEIDSVHGSRPEAEKRQRELAEEVYSDLASDIALYRCTSKDDYIDEYDDAMDELTNNEDRVRIVAETPYTFRRTRKTRSLFGL